MNFESPEGKVMSDYEGSLVLEKLAELDLLDRFWEAVDQDDIRSAERLLRRTELSGHEILTTLKKIRDGDSG
jgi:hypothetical protein